MKVKGFTKEKIEWITLLCECCLNHTNLHFYVKNIPSSLLQNIYEKNTLSSSQTLLNYIPVFSQR